MLNGNERKDSRTVGRSHEREGFEQSSVVFGQWRRVGLVARLEHWGSGILHSFSGILDRKGMEGKPLVSRSRRVSGLTLVEVVLVLAIAAILSATLIPRLNLTTLWGASVEGAASMIASDIRYAQEFAMANRVRKSVIFTAGSSVYTFESTPACSSDRLDPSGRLPSGVTIDSDFTVTFNPLGEPILGGGGSFSISRQGQMPKTIRIVNYTGKVEIPSS